METKLKIKIMDDLSLRQILHLEYEKTSQIDLCRYALLLGKHILEKTDDKNIHHEILTNGYLVNEQWQNNQARMHDVRQAAFQIHRLAKSSEDILVQTALRVVGHAVATGHMKEHAMVASDYAVKVMNLLFPQDLEAVREERRWQINHLKNLKELK